MSLTPGHPPKWFKIRKAVLFSMVILLLVSIVSIYSVTKIRNGIRRFRKVLKGTSYNKNNKLTGQTDEIIQS